MRAELVDRLFARLAAMYGSSKISQMWSNLDMAEVKACWADELRVYSIGQVGQAVDYAKSVHRTFPPSLPEFLALCEQARREKPRGADKPALPAIAAHSAEDVRSAKARCMSMAAALAGGNLATPAWAYVALKRHESGITRQGASALAMIKRAVALDAGAHDPYVVEA